MAEVFFSLVAGSLNFCSRFRKFRYLFRHLFALLIESTLECSSASRNTLKKLTWEIPNFSNEAHVTIRRWVILEFELLRLFSDVRAPHGSDFKFGPPGVC